MSGRFATWLDDHGSSDWHWYIKRLAANDTLATRSHQAGPYVPKHLVFQLFPSIQPDGPANPRAHLLASVDSHDEAERPVVLTWYNQKSRDECRITCWGGGTSAVLDPDTTGSIGVFAFHKRQLGDADYCAVWICNAEEAAILEGRTSPIEPGIPLFVSLLGSARTGPLAESTCSLTRETMPYAWTERFPSGDDIVDHCVALRPCGGMTADDRLLRRRNCEYEMYRSIEGMHVLPRLAQGFQTVDEFILYSNSVNNRRKSRSGRSLELHLSRLFKEESVAFSHGEVSEGNKKPDFLFPSAAAYHEGCSRVRMLAAKTTCKDRWRQVLNEADRIPEKHLLTLQEGVSENQFAEMGAAGLTLVVPAKLHKKYPKPVRPQLLSLSSFIAMVKS